MRNVPNSSRRYNRINSPISFFVSASATGRGRSMRVAHAETVPRGISYCRATADTDCPVSNAAITAALTSSLYCRFAINNHQKVKTSRAAGHPVLPGKGGNPAPLCSERLTTLWTLSTPQHHDTTRLARQQKRGALFEVRPVHRATPLQVAFIIAIQAILPNCDNSHTMSDPLAETVSFHRVPGSARAIRATSQRTNSIRDSSRARTSSNSMSNSLPAAPDRPAKPQSRNQST